MSIYSKKRKKLRSQPRLFFFKIDLTGPSLTTFFSVGSVISDSIKVTRFLFVFVDLGRRTVKVSLNMAGSAAVDAANKSRDVSCKLLSEALNPSVGIFFIGRIFLLFSSKPKCVPVNKIRESSYKLLSEGLSPGVGMNFIGGISLFLSLKAEA